MKGLEMDVFFIFFDFVLNQFPGIYDCLLKKKKKKKYNK